MTEPLSIDQIIERLLTICKETTEIASLNEEELALNSIHSRLSAGELHVAIIGQFNRGKSTFINNLLEIDLLPVSVLPLTAIPTEIRYGSEHKLVIQFEDSAEEFSTKSEIQDALISYVTEKENPENEKGVIAVKLTAPSDLLSHGTTIIDTPGFGSTHIHNTKATLSILKECDAAFFLLSADLPITQMELNFIRQIAPQVTRLFFIYNKTDLLSKNELETTTNFIQDTIQNQIGIDSTERFFPVSAKVAEADREVSGLVRIEQEVLDFLQREKYFSLAEAIRSKLTESSTRMISAVEDHLENLNNDSELIESKVVELEQQEQNLAEQLAWLQNFNEGAAPSFLQVDEIIDSLEGRFPGELRELEKINRDTIDTLNRRIEIFIVEEIFSAIQNELMRAENKLLEKIGETTELFPRPSLSKITKFVKPLPIPSFLDRLKGRTALETTLINELSAIIETQRETLHENCKNLYFDLTSRIVDNEISRICSEVERIQEDRDVAKDSAELALAELQPRVDRAVKLRDEIKSLKV